jgi:hypothetical protein
MLATVSDAHPPGGHVECGSLLPLSAARACPGVLLASTWERQSPDWPLGFFFCAVILPALTQEGSRVPRVSIFPRCFCGRRTHSKNLSSI